MQTASTDAAKATNANIVWHNGVLKPASEVMISPFDHGLTTGDGVFETLIAYNGEPFAFTRHYKRLENSCRTMGLAIPTADVVRDSMRAVLAENGYGEKQGRLRVTITGGDSPLGSDRGEAEQTVITAASEVPDFAPAAIVQTVPFARNDHGALMGLKTISYGENVVALKYAKSRGATEAIFGNTAGNLCEGTGTNIFVVHDGRLMTPPMSSGCLGGITRGLLLDLCHANDIEVAEEDSPLAELKNADEAFLTSTLRHVQPIGEVDGVSLGETPGPFAKKLRELFLELARNTIDPA